MTLPWRRGLLALLETCQSQRWWKWLITAKDCLIVDGEPVLWLVPIWKACKAAYWCLSFPRVMDLSSISQAAGLLFSCGDGLRWLTNVGIFWNREPQRRCCHWLVGWQQFPIANWMGLIGSWKETNPNELKIDVRGPSIPRYFGEHERRQWMCVLEEISVLAIGISASKFSIYCMQEEKNRFLYLLVEFNQASSAIIYLK